MNNTFKDDTTRINKFKAIEENGETFFVITPEWKDFKIKKQLENNLKKSGIPEYVSNLTLDSIIKEDEIKIKLTKYINRFGDKFNSVHLYFWSHKNGTQKTTTASIVAKELILKGFSCRFILMSELSKMLTQESFEEKLEDQINDLLTCDFLVIDDSFDPKKVTIYKSGYQIPFLDTFIRNRIELKRKATCFTSNFAVSEIEEKTFGISLMSLLKRQIIDPFHFTVTFSLRNDFTPENMWS